jgi:hypothetical protein
MDYQSSRLAVEGQLQSVYACVCEAGVSECTVSQESLWLWHRDSSGTQEGECLPLEAGTSALVKGSRLGRPNVCAVNSTSLKNCKWCVQ